MKLRLLVKGLWLGPELRMLQSVNQRMVAKLENDNIAIGCGCVALGYLPSHIKYKRPFCNIDLVLEFILQVVECLPLRVTDYQKLFVGLESALYMVQRLFKFQGREF
jgi:hypothetical protein